MSENSTWEPGWYREEDKPSILDLNRIQYGNNELAQESYFDWIYAKNPLGSPILPVARENSSENVIGFLMQVPLRISWQGEPYPVLIGFNILISKDYRRHGVSTAIYQMAIEQASRSGYHLFLAFPNPKSLNLHIKLQDLIVAEIPLLIRPLNMPVLARRQISNPVVQWGIRAAWSLAGSTIWRERTVMRLSQSIRVEQDREFDEAYDRFWELVRRKYPLMLVRDRLFLDWRFKQVPYRSYHILSARQGNDILGYIVLRKADIRGTSCGLISDFLVEPGARGDQIGLHLLHHASAYFKQEMPTIAGGLFMPGSQEYSLLQQAGYLNSPQRFAPQPFHLVVNNISSLIPSPEIVKPDSWFVSLADHDAV